MNKNFLKTFAAVAVMIIASMFGFKAALGYGGSGGGSSYIATCQSVTYGEWGTCANGVQYRDVLSQNPAYCQMTASQQLARAQDCGAVEEEEEENNQQVLGEKTYAEGTLLRGSDKKVYILVGEKLKHISSLAELAKYSGRKINDVSDSVIASYSKTAETAVLGDKKYGNGQLIRNDDVKVYVIENGKKKHILNLEELAKYYSGKPIYHVTVQELASYEEIAR